MRFRVTSGKNISASALDKRLKLLHSSPSLLIEGDDAVVPFDMPGGGKGFFAGHLVEAKPLATQFESLPEGRFVFALVSANGSCSVGSDAFGQRDLYYRASEGKTIVATDLSLLPKEEKPIYDQSSLAHVLCVYGYRAPKKHTLYRGIRRLGVGETLLFQNDGTVSHRENSFKPAVTENYGEAKLSEYADILLEAVRKRGSEEGNVVYLSSGWDSTALLACLVHHFGAKKVRAVIGRMQYASRSGIVNQFEIDRAKAVADYYKVPLEIVEFDYRTKGPEQLEPWRELFRSHEFPSLTALNLALLASHVQKTARGKEALFAGEISDGVHNLGFSQFTTIFHPVQAFREYSDKMMSYLFGPTFLQLFEKGEEEQDFVYKLLRGRYGDTAFDAVAGDKQGRRRQLLASFFLRSSRFPLWSLNNHRLLTEEGRQAYSEEMESTYLARAAAESTPETLYAWYLHLYNSFHWQGATVAPMALTAETCGSRLELPFWDQNLQKFLAAMPESWGRGLDLNPTKYPLKWALQNRVDYPLHLQVGPHSYLYDVDPTFNHGAEILYASSFTPYFKSLLQKRNYRELLSPRHFNIDFVDAMVDRYQKGTEVRGTEMNELLSLAFLLAVGHS